MLGDYIKTIWNPGAAPGISAGRLNNIEGKVEELDTRLAAHFYPNEFIVLNGFKEFEPKEGSAHGLVIQWGEWSDYLDQGYADKFLYFPYYFKNYAFECIATIKSIDNGSGNISNLFTVTIPVVQQDGARVIIKNVVNTYGSSFVLRFFAIGC